NYRPARYDPGTFTWAYGPAYDATTVPGTTTIPSFNTNGWTANPPVPATQTTLTSSFIDGEYTAGNPAAFAAVTVYYSSSTPGNWGSNASWSRTSVNHVADAGSTPCSTCPVVIGDASNNHVITCNANNQSCGTLNIATFSVLDCSTFTGLSFGA